MGHSSAVRLKYVTFHSLREMTSELMNEWDTQTAFALDKDYLQI